MQGRTKPPFRADHVGSLIRPEALIEARERAERREISDAELATIRQAAIRDVVHMQEELGLRLVTDGEYNRHSWHRDFMLAFRNVRMIPSRLAVRFHRSRDAKALPAVKLAAHKGGLVVELPEGWLDKNPLTRTDLEAECDRLASLLDFQVNG